MIIPQTIAAGPYWWWVKIGLGLVPSDRQAVIWAQVLCWHMTSLGHNELLDQSVVEYWCFMMTSSNGNIFRVTGPLCGEFTGPGEFPTQWPVTRSFDVFFDLRLNKRLSKQPWGWWFETPSLSWWRHCYVMASRILINIGSGNGLLPDDTKPLSQPILTYHQ